MMRTGDLEEILVCSRDHFVADPARRGAAADRAPADWTATWTVPNSPYCVDL